MPKLKTPAGANRRRKGVRIQMSCRNLERDHGPGPDEERYPWSERPFSRRFGGARSIATLRSEPPRHSSQETEKRTGAQRIYVGCGAICDTFAAFEKIVGRGPEESDTQLIDAPVHPRCRQSFLRHLLRAGGLRVNVVDPLQDGSDGFSKLLLKFRHALVELSGS